jgi:hypothetical protein
MEYQMVSPNICNRIVLAGCQGCRVLYCEACNVAEVEIGALSLRLEIYAFNSLGEMVKEAGKKLAIMHDAEKERQPYASVGKAH